MTFNVRFFYFFQALMLAGVVTAQSQAISGFNLSHLYDPNTEVSLQLQPVRNGRSFKVLYQLTSNRIEYSAADYEMQWERRASVSTRNGETSGVADSVWFADARSRSGAVSVAGSDKTWFLVAKVINRITRGVWNFVVSIEPNWPVTFYLTYNNYPVIGATVVTGKNYRIENFPINGKLFGFYYRKPFNPAAPPFVLGTPSDRFIGADSVFSLGAASFTPRSGGLYLFQSDTTSAFGLPVFAASPPFPKYNTIRDLSGPLLYITTADEQVELANSGSDKAKFDRVVLNITRDADRARSFMRSYYQRVESANRFFTNYKEGWRTDMGMIYLIFGVPTEVSRSSTTETWYYRGTAEKFLFNRTGSVFAPFNHFLQRREDYAQTWYSMVDLWRKARF